jgi:hypothetical protein
MGYREALEAAGATVHAYEEFGSYQGRWYARVTYKGETGWINDWHGSCTGCDAFEADVGYERDYCGYRGNGHYDHDPACEKCREAKYGYQDKLAAFGKTYLEGKLKTSDEVLAEIKEDSAYSCDADKALAWVENYARATA